MVLLKIFLKFWQKGSKRANWWRISISSWSSQLMLLRSSITNDISSTIPSLPLSVTANALYPLLHLLRHQYTHHDHCFEIQCHDRNQWLNVCFAQLTELKRVKHENNQWLNVFAQLTELKWVKHARNQWLNVFAQLTELNRVKYARNQWLNVFAHLTKLKRVKYVRNQWLNAFAHLTEVKRVKHVRNQWLNVFASI